MSNYIVVGGSKGIGLDLVQKLLNDQHHVWVLARTSESLLESPNLTFIPTDVTNLSLDVQLLPEHIDGFVYCPGSISLKPFNRLSMDDFNLDWQINVLSGIKLLQMVLPNLLNLNLE
jgi:short-subunit dehydrogenase